MLDKISFHKHFNGTVSLAERCDFVGVKVENVHKLFQVCRICGKGVVFYNVAQYGILYHKSISNQYSIFNLYTFAKII